LIPLVGVVALPEVGWGARAVGLLGLSIWIVLVMDLVVFEVSFNGDSIRIRRLFGSVELSRASWKVLGTEEIYGSQNIVLSELGTGSRRRIPLYFLDEAGRDAVAEGLKRWRG